MHQSMAMIQALSKHMDRSFKRSFKFEAACVSRVDEETGLATTTRGYGAVVENIGTSAQERPKNGDMMVQMNAQTGGAIPLNLGPSGWMTG